jgi:2,4-dienoyl-CoA reductase-like NADH-dependent reductase (Old Yellow Enzyme family)
MSAPDHPVDPLLAPFDLAGVHLRNRIVSTSHEPAYAETGMPKRRYLEYHRAKAQGGVGLTMVGGSSVVSRDSPAIFGNLHLFDDAVVPWLAQLADAIHEEGAAVMCQLTHLGRRSSNYVGDWLPLVAATSRREAAHRAMPKEAEPWDLDRIVQDFAAAASRVAAAGLDGVELEAYGHLLDGFWSPWTNTRTDELGGTLEARLRFPLRVVSVVRSAIGSRIPLGVRMAVDECRPTGLQASEGIEVARRLVDAGVDFLSVIRGHIDTDAGLAQVIPPMGFPSAPHLEFAGWVRRVLGVPVMHAGGVRDVATARYAIREGVVDLVGMTRAQIADPLLVAKVRRGEEGRIRPCVGANYCLDSIYSGQGARCVHNPATGREQSLPHVVQRAPSPRRAVVVGGGPAGLEAARVLAERGHEVVLFEAAERLGGQVLLAAALRRRRELLAIVDWRASECAHLGVEIRTGSLAGAADVTALDPDLVVVASGGLPPEPMVTRGAELVVGSWDVLHGLANPRGAVLVFDDVGDHAGLTVTERLVESGAAVEYVTPGRTVGPEVGETNMVGYMSVLARARVTLGHRLREVRREGGALVTVLSDEYADEVRERQVDAVVVEHGTVPNDDLYAELLEVSRNKGRVDYGALLAGTPQQTVVDPAGAFDLFRIGDAVTGRNIHAAVLDALRLCAAC